MTALRFIHSPFTGAETWQPCAEVMEGYGWSVSTPSLFDAFSGHEPYMQRLAEVAWAGAHEESVVLIVHSGAGALIPAMLAAAPVTVAGVIFVDALVPTPGLSWRDDAPAELTERLDAFTDCGLLPEWNRWFSARLLRELLPDDEECEDFIESLPRVPASYLDEVVPETPAWPPQKAAYLQLSDSYDEEMVRAKALDWRVLSLPMDHLALITQPEEVAEAIQRLIDEIQIEA